MEKNECGDEVPKHIVLKAKKLGSIKCPKYVYRNESYGNKLPMASIGIYRVSRFRKLENANELKVNLGEKWVIFKSPSIINKKVCKYNKRSKRKGVCKPCIICGEDRFIEKAHFPTPDSIGGTKTILLCPTHHKLLDNGRLSISEMKKIWIRNYSQFESFHKFMEWANHNKYPYSIDDFQNKEIWKNYKDKKVTYEISNSI